ncbi:hypothetical protein Tco_0290259 [Tanacetum coccineum]
MHVQENIVKEVEPIATEKNDVDEFVDSGIQSLVDVTLEELNEPADESPFDTKSEIKFMKRFKPLVDNDEPHITFLGPVHSDMEEDYDLASMPDDEVGSLSGVQTSETEEEDNQSQHKELSKSEERDADNVIDELTDMVNADLNAFVDKPSLLDPIGHLRDELTNLTTKVQNLESSISKQVADKLEEYVPVLEAETLKETLPDLISDSLKNAIPHIIDESVQQVTKPMNRQFNMFNKHETARFVVLQKERSNVLKKKMGSSIRQEVRKGMEEVRGKLEYCTSRVDQNSVDEEQQPKNNETEEAKQNQTIEQTPPISEDPPTTEKVPPVLTALMVLPFEIKTSEETPTEDEPLLKRQRIFDPDPNMPTLTPLSSYIPPNIRPSIVINTPLNQDSSIPPKHDDKGKGIAIEEDPLKELIPLMDEGGSNLKMPNFKPFITPERPMTIEDFKAQLAKLHRLEALKQEKEKSEESLKGIMNPATLKAQAHKLAEYEAKRAKILAEYNHYITFRADQRRITKINYRIDRVTKDATMRIERDNQPLSLVVIEKFRLKQLAGKLGLPSPSELSAFRLSGAKKKRKRASEMLEEVFVKEYIRVDGMHRNLIPPQGVVGSKGLVITDQRLGFSTIMETLTWSFRERTNSILPPPHILSEIRVCNSG